MRKTQRPRERWRWREVLIAPPPPAPPSLYSPFPTFYICCGAADLINISGWAHQLLSGFPALCVLGWGLSRLLGPPQLPDCGPTHSAQSENTPHKNLPLCEITKREKEEKSISSCKFSLSMTTNVAIFCPSSHCAFLAFSFFYWNERLFQLRPLTLTGPNAVQIL